MLYRVLSGYSLPEDSLLTTVTQEICFSSLHFKCLPFVSHRFPWSAIHKCKSIQKIWLQTSAMSILETCSLWTPQITAFQSLAQYVACSLSLLVSAQVLHDSCEQHQDNFWM